MFIGLVNYRCPTLPLRVNHIGVGRWSIDQCGCTGGHIFRNFGLEGITDVGKALWVKIDGQQQKVSLCEYFLLLFGRKKSAVYNHRRVFQVVRNCLAVQIWAIDHQANWKALLMKRYNSISNIYQAI